MLKSLYLYLNVGILTLRGGQKYPGTIHT